jgi:hypothetical protein
MNAVKARLGGIATFLSPYKTTIQMVSYILVAGYVLYLVYGVMYPAADRFEQVVINKSINSSQLKGFQQKLYPPMTTGGEYSFQTWIYINNLDYKPGVPKHVFTIASDGSSGSNPPHVTMIGLLNPTENKLIIRVNQDTAGLNTGGGGPDFTLNSNITNLFSGNLDVNAGRGPGGQPICDITDLDVQRWICLAVVVNGRTVDVYIDGKMARSCVCPGIPIVDPGNNYLTMGLLGGWGGSVSTTRFFGYALTPVRVHEFYQQGPAPLPVKSSGLMGILNMLGLSLDTTPALTLPPVIPKAAKA